MPVVIDQPKQADSTPPAAHAAKGVRTPPKRATNLVARGEPMVWLTGGCCAAAVLMIVLLLGFITFNGFATFWPAPLEQVKLKDGRIILGEPARRESYTPQGAAHPIERILYRTGNYDTTGNDFTWVDVPDIQSLQTPQWALVVERLEWGNAYGTLEGVTTSGGQEIRDPASAWQALQEVRHDPSDAAASNTQVLLRTAGGVIVPADRGHPEKPMTASQIVRVYPANQLGTWGRLGVYFSRWWEYLSANPRESNTEGGVFPAIFGTILLMFIMIIFVVPIGVVTAIYLREYARPGLLLSIVRISVNNLAGVPSVVFGVFGLGFFIYGLGGWIDSTFFPGASGPVLGKGALIWASLTLALLTLPVVIVATEEALAAVPRSMREGSFACGASKWQTIRRIVLPRAMPGIMTGMILAIARGAGEVAPLMLVGVVKIANDLPISPHASQLFGINRSFLHLGFHIFDLGFQSRNAEAAKSMVYTTTFLLIALVVILNLAAMAVRSRLRRAYATGHF